MTVHISQILNRQAKVNAALSFLIYFCSHEDTENTNTYTQFSQATQEYEPYMEQHISFYTRSRKRGTHNWPRSPSGRAVKRRCTHAGAEQWKTSEVRRKASDANKESILSNKQSMKSLSVSFFAKKKQWTNNNNNLSDKSSDILLPPQTSWLCVCECAIVGPSPHTLFTHLQIGRSNDS